MRRHRLRFGTVPKRRPCRRTPKRIAVLILLLLSAVAGAAELSRADRQERIQKLPDAYRQFLADVEPIMENAERDAFLTIETDTKRDAYIENFWRRHAPPTITGNGFKAQYYARVEEAADKYHRGTDRYRTFVVNGPPRGFIETKCHNYLVPIELWHYFHVPQMGHDVTLLFYVPRGQDEYVLWHPIGPGMTRYDDLLSDTGHQRGVENVFLGPRVPNTVYREPPLMDADCQSFDVLHRAVDDIARHGPEQLRAMIPVRTPVEPMRLLLKPTVAATKDAPQLAADVTVRFPRKAGNRVDTQITVTLNRAQLVLNDAASAYTIDVTGEVMRSEAVYESYHYRFDVPAESAGDKVPVVIDRVLPPGRFTVKLKIVDVKSCAETVVDKELYVPDTLQLPAASLAPLVQNQPDAPETELRIVPLRGEMQTGMQHIDTIATGVDIKVVDFFFDGRKVATKRQPPFSFDLDVGPVPLAHRIRVLAFNQRGDVIAGDEITLNTGTIPFRVRIVSPRVAVRVKGKLRVEVMVKVPYGKKLDSVQLFWNRRRVATLYDPPYVQVLDVPQSEGVTYLRAVASLKDDPTPPVEDVVLVNTPEFMEEVNVHLIELPTTVIANGRPLRNLPEASFRVLDEGRPVKLVKFEQLDNLPLSIGVAIDTSDSMLTRLFEAQNAGALFFRNVVKSGDKAFLLSFDTEPRMVQPWTTNIAEVDAALSRLHAEEATALFDAVVYSLYNFAGVKGQKALVLITDGEDNVSKFTFEQTLEYARRTAVPIYAIGIAINKTRLEAREQLARLGTETGGNVYFIDHADELNDIYRAIEEELRSQYLLGFNPPPGAVPGGPWREVSVFVREGLAKTVAGYYP